ARRAARRGRFATQEIDGGGRGEPAEGQTRVEHRPLAGVFTFESRVRRQLAARLSVCRTNQARQERAEGQRPLAETREDAGVAVHRARTYPTSPRRAKQLRRRVVTRWGARRAAATRGWLTVGLTSATTPAQAERNRQPNERGVRARAVRRSN